VRTHVVIVEGLFAQPSLTDEGVDGADGSVSPPKQGFAVDLAEELVSDLDAGVGSDHLQIEHRPAGGHRLGHMA